MHYTRKIASLLLALVMVFALATTVSAASITITGNLPSNGSTTGETYNAYKIFDATYEGETVDSNTNIAYTIDSSSPFFEDLNKIEGLLTNVNNTTTYIVDTTKITNDNINNIVATLKNVVDSKSVQPTGTAKAGTDGNATINNLDKGYYLVTSTLGSKIIVDTLGSVTVQTKNTYPTVDKKEDKTTADYGETVTYTVTVTIPENAVGAITLHDTMTNMVYNDNSVSAKVKDTETNVAITKQNADGDNCTLHFVISAETVATNLGNTVEVTYTANVEGGKNIGKNKVQLEYSNYLTPEIEVEVKNYKLDVFKYTQNGETKTGLAGAGFVLAKKVTDGENGTKTVYYKKTTTNTIEWVDNIDDATELKTAAESYIVTFDGLANGTYTLIEKTVPAGYNQAQNLDVTIQDADKTGATQVEVLNQTGTELPSTGGMGTTIFYILGSALVLAAGVLLVTKKRMSTEG